MIDQFRLERDKADPEKTLSDPNRPDEEEYMLRLIGHAVTVSIESLKLVESLPALDCTAKRTPKDKQNAPPDLSDPATAVRYAQAEADAGHPYFVKEDTAPPGRF